MSSPDPMTLYRQAEAQRHARMRTFNEIMTGPNPLTPTEIRKLINKRPDIYSFMEPFAAPEEDQS